MVLNYFVRFLHCESVTLCMHDLYALAIVCLHVTYCCVIIELCRHLVAARSPLSFRGATSVSLTCYSRCNAEALSDSDSMHFAQ